MSERKKKVQKPHWYRFESYRCPMCGNGEGEWKKERVYGRKPKNLSKRYVEHQSYDWCNEYAGLY